MCSKFQDHMNMEPLDEFNRCSQKAEIKNQLKCCSDCLVNFNREAQGVMSAKQDFMPSTSNSSLPLWLQQCKDQNVTKQINSDQVNYHLLKRTDCLFYILDNLE